MCIHRWWVVILVALTVSACGFQLRGEVNLPPALSPMHIEGLRPGALLGRDLERSLQAGGIELAASRVGAASRLLIPVDDLRREVLSVGETARVREFMLRYRVEFELRDANGEVRVPRQQVELVREFSFDERQALGAASEEAVLREEMQREMGRRVLERLQTALQTLAD